MAAEGAAGVEDGRGVCLATVTTANFLPGTLVAIGSFLKTHPEFNGDVAVIHDDLPEKARDLLRLSFDRLRFVQVSPELRERAERLVAARPWFRRAVSHFYAFETFRLAGYRKVLFCDGDLLFRQPIGELFDAEDALLCCGDYAFLRGKYRDKATFMATDDPTDAFAQTFNDGFLLIDAALLGESSYAELLAMLTPETWPDPDMFHTKQFLQNRYLAGRQTIISSTYNFLLASPARPDTRPGGRGRHGCEGAALQLSGQALDAGRLARMGIWPHPGRGFQALVRRLDGLPGRQPTAPPCAAAGRDGGMSAEPPPRPPANRRRRLPKVGDGPRRGKGT